MTTPRGKRRIGPFGSFARSYATAYWSPVPVEPHSKRIAVDGFTGHDGAYADDATLDSWTETYRDHNIGLRLPYSVIGIDVDAYGSRDGASSLALLEADLGELPPTYMSTSRADGVSGIRLFRVPDDATNWRGNVGKDSGIDIVSWHYRYVVCEPSVHPGTGNTYHWYWSGDSRPGSVGTPTEMPSPEDLPELPEAWADRLASDSAFEKIAKMNPKVIDHWIEANSDGEPCELIRATTDHWISEVESALDAGGIHDNMIFGIKAIIGDAMAGHEGMSRELERLRKVFMTARRERHDARSSEAAVEWRGAKLGAVRGNISSERYADDPCTDEYASAAGLKDMKPQTSGGIVYDERARDIMKRAEEKRRNQEAGWLVQTEGNADAPHPQNGADFLALDIPEPRVLVDKLLLLDGNTVLVAQRKAGKTTLVHNLIKSMCDDTDFLGAYTIDKPKGMKFALLDFEMQQGMLLKWLRDVKVSLRGARSLELFSFRGASSSFNILSRASRISWANRLADCGVQFLILDCLAPAMAANGMDENDTYAASAFLNGIDEIMKMAGIAGSLVVHHMGHSGERGRGASRIRDWPETEIHLIPEGQGDDDNGHLRPRAQRFLAAEGRLGAFDELGLSYEEDGRRLFVSSGSREEAAVEAAVPSILNYVQEHPGCSKSAALAGASGSRRTSKMRAMTELINDGSICVHVGGRGSHNLYDEKVCPDDSQHAIKINVK